MRAPARASWRATCFPSVSRSRRRIRGRCKGWEQLPDRGAPGARARRVAGPGTPLGWAHPRQSSLRLSRARATRRKPAGFEIRRRGEKQTPLPVRLHLLHVAHTASATAPAGKKSETRLTVIAALHKPLSLEVVSFCDVQINPAPMQTFFALLSKLRFSSTFEQPAGGRKKGKKK